MVVCYGVIVPDRFRREILEELHFSNPGMCRMKALARGYVWWPCLDADIEDYVKGCHACINTYQAPKTTVLGRAVGTTCGIGTAGPWS